MRVAAERRKNSGERGMMTMVLLFVSMIFCLLGIFLSGYLSLCRWVYWGRLG